MSTDKALRQKQAIEERIRREFEAASTASRRRWAQRGSDAESAAFEAAAEAAAEAARDSRALRSRIRRELELGSRRQKVAPLPPLPRIPQCTREDKIVQVVLLTRFMGLTPISVERVARMPSSETYPSAPAAPAAQSGRPESFQSSLFWVVYAYLLAICITVLNLIRLITNGMDLGNPDVTSGLRDVLYVIAYSASFVTSLAMMVGMHRKYRLLPAVLNWPVAAAATRCPSTLRVILETVVVLVSFAVANYPVVLRWPFAYPLVFFVVTTLFERLMLTHLVKRVGIYFATINDDLLQLSALVHERASRKYLPDTAAKITLLRTAHDKAADMLHAVNKAYEVQMVSVVLYDFVTSILVAYQSLLLLAEFEVDGDKSVIFFIVNSLYSLATTCIACRECRRTSQLGSVTYTYVHKALSCMAISEEESQQLQIFSLQLLHRKFTVSPLGMFDMDNTLLASMSMGALMYIVVLVQLNLA